MAKDRAHFADYREQTRVKHAILEKYLAVYFRLLSWQQNLVYIDGFAGRGTYDDPESPGGRADGSPVRALKKLAEDPELASKVTTIFIEQDEELVRELTVAVESASHSAPRLRPPQVCHGEFAPALDAVLNGLAGAQLAPTFLFADPCGVRGMSFATLERFLSQRHCECLLFFNIEGVRRILGLGAKMGSTLPELLGSATRAAELSGRVRACSTPKQREECIVSYYTELLRSTRAQFVTLFRVEKVQKRATSHYLIHATSNATGFRIMKDVMWSLGETAEGAGGLALEQATVARGGVLLLCPRAEAIQAEVLKELATGPKRVQHFYEVLTEEPGNQLSTSAYRKALLELEAGQRIEVLDKRGADLAGKRKRGTLGKDYHVRLKQHLLQPLAAMRTQVEKGDRDHDDDVVTPGRCLRCYAATPASGICCQDCGSTDFDCHGEEVYEDQGRWYVVDHDPESPGDSEPIACGDCGSENLDVDFELMCGYCANVCEGD